MLPLLWVVNAGAHEIGLSTAVVTDDSLALAFSAPELNALAPVRDLSAARLVLHDLLVAPLRITAGGLPCTLGTPAWTSLDGDGIGATLPLDCPGARQGATWTYAPGFLGDLAADHRHVVSWGDSPPAGAPSGTSSATTGAVVLTRTQAHTTWTDASRGTAEVAGSFVRLGVEHIWTGYDHLAFLAALLLVTTRLRDMLLVVTGFTLAHSLTLTAAALGWVNLPSRVVEPAIAASIVLVGIENLWTPSARRRLPLTFVLGCIHGFGFAGLRAELGLPRGHLVTALVAFNAGVELGQTCLVALALPVLLWLRRWPAWERRGVPVLSLGIALCGVGWLVERLLG